MYVVAPHGSHLYNSSGKPGGVQGTMHYIGCLAVDWLGGVLSEQDHIVHIFTRALPDVIFYYVGDIVWNE